MAGHFGDEFALDLIGGFFGFEEAAEQVVVFVMAFADQYAEPATQSVLDAIGRDGLPAGGGARPGAFLSVGAVGGELAFGDRHGVVGGSLRGLREIGAAPRSRSGFCMNIGARFGSRVDYESRGAEVRRPQRVNMGGKGIEVSVEL